MNFTIYNPETGEILYNCACSDETLVEPNLNGCQYVSGMFTTESYYIQDNIPVPKGDRPSNNHLFDYTTKSWQLDNNLLEQSIRQQRNQSLTLVDQINPVWYASLTADQQQDLATYRQHLLDVPQQTGFPDAIEWPAKPTWL